MDITVVGAGNGGRTAAAHLTLLGHRVSLVDRFPEQLRDVAERGTLTLSGALEGTATIDLVTADLAVALEGSRLVLVSMPAFALEWFAQVSGPHLKPDHIVVLHPGGTVGAFVVRSTWDRLGDATGTVLAATESLVYACRLTAAGEPDVRAVKQRLQLGALPSSGLPAALAAMHRLYPQAVGGGDVLSVGVANLNPVIHPPISILNAARLDRGEPFDFYGDGVTPAVSRWIDALDRERLAIGEALGLVVEPLARWIQAAYGVRGPDTAAIFGELARVVYRGIPSPDHLESRYLTEDIPFGLVPLIALARLVGVATPNMTAVVQAASAALGRDLVAESVPLERIGLDAEATSKLAGHVA